MISHSVLRLLLVLTFLQSFATAQDKIGPFRCCFQFLAKRIPKKLITNYRVTARQCTKPGVIFTLKNNPEVCVDPDVKWVQKTMNYLNQRLHIEPDKPASTASAHRDQPDKPSSTAHRDEPDSTTKPIFSSPTRAGCK
ncbi:hypothetical protein HF521_020065 [Silurus meridionalis]|uniref:C-C motif chemokine n=1 Tax=Silurus meridionalis TaxID=175797 RepID=A0A8T0BHY9_SILME|nr:hypothetical protein HF521_020065 [Silurus meridionalis]